MMENGKLHLIQVDQAQLRIPVIAGFVEATCCKLRTSFCSLPAGILS
jgi:hypothetical protein